MSSEPPTSKEVEEWLRAPGNSGFLPSIHWSCLNTGEIYLRQMPLRYGSCIPMIDKLQNGMSWEEALLPRAGLGRLSLEPRIARDTGPEIKRLNPEPEVTESRETVPQSKLQSLLNDLQLCNQSPVAVVADDRIRKRKNKILAGVPGICTANPIAAITNFCRHHLGTEIEFKIDELVSSNLSEPDYEIRVILAIKGTDIVEEMGFYRHSRKKFAKEQVARLALTTLNKWANDPASVLFKVINLIIIRLI